MSTLSAWEETTVGDFAPFNYGKSLPKRLRNSSGNVTVFGSNGIVGRHDKPLSDGPGIIIGRKGTVGAVHFSPGPFWPIDTTFYILPDSRRDILFTYYLLHTLGLESMNSDSAVPGLNRNAAHARAIVIPPLPEQRAIAAILRALDDKIELNHRMNQTLEAMAQALFKSWFVDFEPFRGQGMVDSPLGEIQLGWRYAAVSEAIEINPSRKVERGADAIYIDMASLPTASARVLTVIRRAFTGSGSRFRNGDILLARITPCLENGKTAIVDFLEGGENGWGSTEFIILGPKPPLSTHFIYCLARNADFRTHAIQAMTGTSGRQRVDTGCFNNYWLAVPPKSVTERFDHKVEPWFQMMKANDDESHVLAIIRDALLPKLVSGEIRLRDAERFMEEAA